MSGYRKLLPGEKIRIAFLFQIASFWPSWESLYHFLLTDERFSVRLYLVLDSVDNAKQLQTAEQFLAASGLAYTAYNDEKFEAFAPHIAVVQTPYDLTQREHHLYAARLKREGIRVVYIPYGIEIVDTRAARHNHFREPVIRDAWKIYTLSDDFKREYEKYCENARAVRALGLPRFDMLLQRERFVLPEKIRQKARGRKCVVWQTHFAKTIYAEGKRRQVTPYLEEYIVFARSLAEYKDRALFIFRAHPRFGDDTVDVENNMKSGQLLKILHNCENVFVDTAEDYRPVLLNADAIIIDRSALAVESGVIGVPVLYMKNPDFDERIFPPLIPLFNSYEQGTGAEDMKRFIERFLANELKPAERVGLPNLDGKCAERIAEDLANSIHEPEPEEKPRRFVLFGTGFIYQLMMQITAFPADCSVVALSDNDSSKWGREYHGVAVVPPEKINDFSFDKIIICAENVFEEEIERQLLFDLEIPANKIEHCDYLSLL